MNKVKLKGVGNYHTYFYYLKKYHINIYDVTYDKDTIYFKIDKKDLKKIRKIKTTYQVSIERFYGIDYLKLTLKKHKIFLLFFLFSFFLLFYFESHITKVEIIHSNPTLKKEVEEILKDYDIAPYRKIKSKKEIKKIKEKIKEEKKDTIEWIEMKQIGTTYEIKLEQRKQERKKEESKPSNIISLYDATVKEIYAESGVIKKKKEDYVKKGDILIEGNVYLNEEKKGTQQAKGTVMGEVWYKVTIEYPYFYYEVVDTKKRKKVFVFSFFDKKIETNKKYKKVKKKWKIENNLFPIFISIEDRVKTKEVKQKLTKKEVEEKAFKKIEEKIKKSLGKKEHIISIKKLNCEENNSKIILEAYVFIYKQIGIEQEIKE